MSASTPGAAPRCRRLGQAISLDDVAKAHAADLEHQDEQRVHYLRYWVDEDKGQIFCLVDAPDAEAANEIHRVAHGLVTDEIHPVREGVQPD